MLRFVTLVLVFSAVTSVSFAHDVKGPVSIQQYLLDRVSPSIYVVHVHINCPTPKTAGS